MKNKTLIKGDGYLCSPNMEDFCKRMVAKEVAESKEDVPSRHFGYWNISDRH